MEAVRSQVLEAGVPATACIRGSINIHRGDWTWAGIFPESHARPNPPNGGLKHSKRWYTLWNVTTVFNETRLRASMPKPSLCGLSAVTVQLIEAACRARDGDSDGTRVHIARAVALLDQHPDSSVGHLREGGAAQIPRGGFAAWQLRRLVAHVDANLADKIVVKDLAASLDISISHFCRAFKRTFGMPARIWIRRRRIELAQGLMLTTGASLTHIAVSCGMSDQSHFTRSFRRIVGETPSSWRQRRHGAVEERSTQSSRRSR
jgi:AraC family transcriptional regulator